MRYEDVPKISVWEQDSAAFAAGSRVAAMRQNWGPKGAPGTPSGRNELTAIDAQIKSYAATYSPMAKINVLNDLQRAIAAWQQTHPGVPPAAMVAA